MLLLSLKSVISLVAKQPHSFPFLGIWEQSQGRHLEKAKDPR